MKVKRGNKFNCGGAGGEWGEENIVSLLKRSSFPSPSLIRTIYAPRISEPKSPLYDVIGVNKFLRKVMIFLRKKRVNSVNLQNYANNDHFGRTLSAGRRALF